jgi:hypothetical protein
MSVRISFFLIILKIFVIQSVSSLICDEGYVQNGNDSCDECGFGFNFISLRIVGGRPAEPFSWPAHVLIVQRYMFKHNSREYSISFRCGGTLINRNTVLRYFVRRSPSHIFYFNEQKKKLICLFII